VSRRLSGAAWSFVGTTFEESVAIWKALGVSAIDLLAATGASLDPAQIVTQPFEAASVVSNLGVPIANIIFIFGTDFSDRALNHSDPAVRSRNAREFESVLRFCTTARISSITLLPGVEQAGWTRKKSLDTAGEVLNEFTARGAEAGVAVCFEPHVQSLLEDPAEVHEFLRINPALRLTLDYSHFICAGYTQDQIDVLAPFAGHVHLRQARPGMLQARWSEGSIDFARVVQVLETNGYPGFYAFEYEHDAWMDNDNVDVISETIKMRNHIRPMLR
jgi:sugar phosphate isomerase/epimerase